MARPRLISTQLPHPIVDVQLADAHDGKGTGVEHRVADADDDVVQNCGDEAEKHECNCKCDHDYWYLRVNNYALIFSLLIQR